MPILLLLTLLAVAVSAEQTEREAQVETLIRDFVQAFNTKDQDIMAAFYAQFASTSFQERRDEQEDRQLHTKLLEQFGTLGLRSIDSSKQDEAVLVATSGSLGTEMQVRFRIVGEPPRIDGFSIGMADAEHGTPEPSSPSSHGGGHAAANTSGPDSDGPFGFLATAEDVYQPQLFTQPNGSLTLVWVQAGAHDLDLFVASQASMGDFSHPTRINHAPVNSYTGDEARPAVAFGPEGRIAVAWTAANGDIMLAAGTTEELIFDAPIKLNQDKNESYRTMPAMTFTPDGVADAIWIDGRNAPKGMEEPANIYYARVVNGVAEEHNLTAQQEASVCGCCRPFIHANAKGELDIAFRNTTAAGYRDIFNIFIDAEGSFSAPLATTPPMWKIRGCPMSGPIRYDDGTLWRDASTGTWRLLWATEAANDPTDVLGNGDDLDLTRPPRTVSGADTWVLIGSSPQSFLIAKNKSKWKIIREDLPEWASSAAFKDGQLILVGSAQGHFQAEAQPFTTK